MSHKPTITLAVGDGDTISLDELTEFAPVKTLLHNFSVRIRFPQEFLITLNMVYKGHREIER